MLKVDRYIVKIGNFGAYFYDQQEKKDMTLDDVAALLNKDIQPVNLSVSNNIPFEQVIESDGMPLQPIMEMEKKVPTIEGAQLPGLGFR